jgi:diguanylate cyclase (GGDEF)-like protein
MQLSLNMEQKRYKMNPITLFILSMGSLLLVIIMAILYLRYKEKHIKYWFFCFGFLLLANIALLLSTQFMPIFWLFLYVFFAVFSSYAFLRGMVLFNHQEPKKWHSTYMWFGLVLVSLITFMPFPLSMKQFLIYLFMSSFYMLTLKSLFLSKHLSHRFTAINVLLLILIMITYPLITQTQLMAFLTIIQGFLGLSLGLSLVTMQLLKVHDEEEKIKHSLTYLSFHDSMTGLYNRAYMDHLLEQIDEASFLPVSIIMADLNNLKAYNDQYGHECGDYAIVSVSDVMKSLANDKHSIIRRGGDEFVIIMSHSSKEDAIQLSKKIQEKCYEIVIEKTPIELSVGAATRSSLDQRFTEIMRLAEIEMYLEKERMRRKK